MSISKTWKRALALFLAVVMAIGFAPNITARAAATMTAVDGWYESVDDSTPVTSIEYNDAEDVTLYGIIEVTKESGDEVPAKPEITSSSPKVTVVVGDYEGETDGTSGSFLVTLTVKKMTNPVTVTFESAGLTIPNLVIDKEKVALPIIVGANDENVLVANYTGQPVIAEFVPELNEDDYVIVSDRRTSKGNTAVTVQMTDAFYKTHQWGTPDEGQEVDGKEATVGTISVVVGAVELTATPNKTAVANKAKDIVYTITGTSDNAGFVFNPAKLSWTNGSDVDGTVIKVDPSTLASGTITVSLSEAITVGTKNLGTVSYSDGEFEGTLPVTLKVGYDSKTSLSVVPKSGAVGLVSNTAINAGTSDKIPVYAYRLNYTSSATEKVGPTLATVDVTLAGEAVTTDVRVVDGGLTNKVSGDDEVYYFIVETEVDGVKYQATMGYKVLADIVTRQYSEINESSLVDADGYDYVYGNTKAFDPKVNVYEGAKNDEHLNKNFDQTKNVTWYYFDKAVLAEKSRVAEETADTTALVIGASADAITNIATLSKWVNTETGALTDEAKKYKMDNKPENAGDYYVLAVIAATDKYAVMVPAIKEMHIDKKPIYIVPNDNPGKTFGQEETAIGFKAYEYYNSTEALYETYYEALAKALMYPQYVNGKMVYTQNTKDSGTGKITVTTDVLTKDNITGMGGKNPSEATFAAMKAEYESLYAKFNATTSDKYDSTTKIGVGSEVTISETAAPLIIRSANKDTFVDRSTVTLTKADSEDIRKVLVATGEYAESYPMQFNEDKFTNYVAVTNETMYLYPKFNEYLVPSFSRKTELGTGDTGLISVTKNGKVTNDKYTIAKRALGLVEINLLDDSKTEAAKAVKNRTVKSTDQYKYTGEVITPDFKVLDTVAMPVMVKNPDYVSGTSATNTEYIVSVGSSDGKVVYSPTNKMVVGYRNKLGNKTENVDDTTTGTWNNTTKSDYFGDFALNEEGSTGKGSGTYTLSITSDLQNYTGTATKLWKISNTGIQYDAKVVYINGDNEDELSDVNSSEKESVKGVFNTKTNTQGEEYVIVGSTYTIPYDGVAHQLGVWVNPKAYNSQSTAADKYELREEYDNYNITWTNLADYEYIGMENGHAKVLTEKAGKTWKNEFPENVVLAGTYKFRVQVTSLGKNYDTYTKDVTIQIDKVKMTVETAKGKAGATIEAYSTKDEIIAAARKAQNAVEKTKNGKSFEALEVDFESGLDEVLGATNVLGKNEDLVLSKTEFPLSNVIRYATYPDVLPYTFEFNTDDMTSVGTPEINARFYTKDEVKDIVTNFIATGYDDVNGNGAWAKLADDKKTAELAEADNVALFDKAEAYRRVCDSYIPTFIEGTINVTEVSYEFAVFVHDKDAWNAAEGKWMDLNLDASQGKLTLQKVAAGEAWQNVAGTHEWTYGAYDVVGGNVEVFIQKPIYGDNPSTAGVVEEDYLRGYNYSALPDALKSKLRFRVTTPTGGKVSGFDDIAIADLETKLFELPAGNYKIIAFIDKIVGEVGFSDGESGQFTVDKGQLIMKEGDDFLVGDTATRGEGIKALKKAMVYVEGGKTALNPSDSKSDTYHLEYSYTGAADTYSDDITDFVFGIDYAEAAEKASDFFGFRADYSTAKEQWLYVKAVSDLKDSLTSMGDSYDEADQKVVKRVKITIVNQDAGKNDKVDNLNFAHTADQKGKTFTTGVSTAIEKEYGTYTYNDKNDDGTYIKDSRNNFISETKENKVTFAGAGSLVSYITDELLYHNGYAVGNQNTYLKWMQVDASAKDSFGEEAYSGSVLARYEDAKKVAYEMRYSDGITGAKHIADVDPVAETVLGYIPNAGNGADVQQQVRDGYNSFITYNGELLGGGKAGTPSYLLAGVDATAIKAEVTSDPKNILAKETVTVDGVSTEKYYVDVTARGDVTYKLADNADNGRAVITVTVSRTNFKDITFDINVIMDADVPQIGVKNIELSVDPSTEFNKKATVDTFVKAPLEFTVDVTGALEEKGKFYYFASEPYTSITALEAAIDEAVAAGKTGWTELKEATVTTPAVDGPYVLYVYAIDEAGNKTYVSSANGYTVDSVAPVIKNSEDTSIEYNEEEVKEIVVPKDQFGTIKVEDAALESVKANFEGEEPVELEQITTTKSYKLAPSEKTYTITAVDKAKNVSKAKIDVLIAVDNKGNEISKTYDGKDIDLANIEVDGKKLFDISELAGAPTYKDVTQVKDSNDNFKYQVAGVRGEGTVEGNMLKVTKAGTFAIELTTAKNKIYGSLPVIGYLTINKGTREVGISLVNPDGSAKTEFSDTEAKEIEKYVKLTFSDDSTAPAAEFIKYNFYKKGSDTAETSTPFATGEYEVTVDVDDDGLYNATKSVESKLEALKDLQKASYTIDDDNNKIKIKNDDTMGTVKVTKEDGTAIEDLNKVAKRTKVVIELTPSDGYFFTGWTDAAGIEVTDAKATKLTGEVATDIELTANYAVGVKITKQPENQKLFANETAKLEVTATGAENDELAYQWYVKTAKEADFKEIVGATAASYETAKVTLANNGDSYKVVVTSKVTGDSKTSEVATVEVVGHSIEGAVITLKADSAEYTGKNIVPEIAKVMLGEQELSVTRDYELADEDRVNAGEYTIKITGKGDYSGEASTKFTITPKALTKDMFSAEDVNYTGKAVETVITAKDGEVELKADTDYTVAYKNNTEVGTATATITGKGNYTGSVDVTFEILGKSIKGATVSGLATAAYTGKAITPAVTVTLDGKTLKKGTDYTVAYKNNKAVGTATVTITGKGDYSGKITKKFLIKKISFKYRAYVQKKSWMGWSTAKVSGTSASAMAGTTDNLRMETIQMQMSGVSGYVKYRAYVEKMGWTQWAQTNKTETYAGTKGLKRRVEMIQLQASGQVATLYDMYYRAYSEKFGWLGWAKSGEKAGSAGYALKLEAFQVNFVRKGETFSVKSDRTKCFYDKTKDGANPK